MIFIIFLQNIKEQERIVSIFDCFDTLYNDLSSGLPAEIEARQKQYEYYRKTTGTDIDVIMPAVSRFGGGNRAEKKKRVIERLMVYYEKYAELVGLR